MDESDLHLLHWSCLVLLLVFVVDGGAAAWAGAWAGAEAWAGAGAWAGAFVAFSEIVGIEETVEIVQKVVNQSTLLQGVSQLLVHWLVSLDAFVASASTFEIGSAVEVLRFLFLKEQQQLMGCHWRQSPRWMRQTQRRNLSQPLLFCFLLQLFLLSAKPLLFFWTEQDESLFVLRYVNASCLTEG